jgi:hypothetical protein
MYTATLSKAVREARVSFGKKENWMEAWDMNAVSQGFFNIAQEADRYLREVRLKLKWNKSYEPIFDEHLAKFYVYNYFHGRTFLVSRHALVEELRNLKNTPFPGTSEALDAKRFEHYRKIYIEELITEYTS